MFLKDNTYFKGEGLRIDLMIANGKFPLKIHVLLKLG